MKATLAAPWAAAAGGAAVVAAPLGYRIGILPPGAAFLLLAGGVLIVAGSGMVLLVTVARRRGARVTDRASLAALAVSVMVGAVPVGALLSARGAPPIHDITTDTENPPPFAALVALNSPGRTDYGGAAVAEQQRAAYPDIRPLMLAATTDEAFRRALTAIEQMGWALVATDPDSLRIEATDRSFWFGFEDDVVIRITAAGEMRSRVDVRSLSRVGVGDLGVNARRVRAFLAALKEA